MVFPSILRVLGNSFRALPVEKTVVAFIVRPITVKLGEVYTKTGKNIVYSIAHRLLLTVT